MEKDINERDLKEFYDKGMLAFEKKNYGYAIEIFSQILSLRWDHLEARHYLHLSLKDRTASNPSSFIANILNPVNRLIGVLSGETLLKKGNVPGALERLEKILAAIPSDANTLERIADVFYKNNLIPHAIQNLEEVKAINPKDINILKKLGGMYLKKEDYRNAKSNYEQALQINPNDQEALRSLKNLDALGTIKQEFGS